MEPTEKSPQIDALLSALAGKDRATTIRVGKCMTCNRNVQGFRDSLSRKEYSISGMCQSCQDSVFGK